MEIGNLIPHIESLIFASEKPLTSLELTELINNAFGFMEDKIVLDQIEAALEGIVEKYRSEFYPFEVRESGGGWQFLTKRDYHKTVAQLNGDKFLKRLSTAALEALSIVAYKQPVTKGEIEAIRGVSSDYAIQKLLEKELIVITGRNEALPGHPLVYATSKTFMDYFGINSPADLPKLKEVFDEAMVDATSVSDATEAGAAAKAAEAGEITEVMGEDGKLLKVGPGGELIEEVEATEIAEEGLEINEAGEPLQSEAGTATEETGEDSAEDESEVDEETGDESAEEDSEEVDSEASEEEYDEEEGDEATEDEEDEEGEGEDASEEEDNEDEVEEDEEAEDDEETEEDEAEEGEDEDSEEEGADDEADEESDEDEAETEEDDDSAHGQDDEEENEEDDRKK